MAEERILVIQLFCNLCKLFNLALIRLPLLYKIADNNLVGSQSIAQFVGGVKMFANEVEVSMGNEGPCSLKKIIKDLRGRPGKAGEACPRRSLVGFG